MLQEITVYYFLFCRDEVENKWMQVAITTIMYMCVCVCVFVSFCAVTILGYVEHL